MSRHHPQYLQARGLRDRARRGSTDAAAIVKEAGLTVSDLLLSYPAKRNRASQRPFDYFVLIFLSTSELNHQRAISGTIFQDPNDKAKKPAATLLTACRLL